MSSISSTSSSGVAAFNIDGLVSGMNTTDVITKLMQVEALPQTLLKSRKAGFEAASTALSAVRSSLVSLKTASSGVANLVGWEPVQASTTSDAVTVTGTSAQATGSVSFHVDSLAKAHTLASSGTAADTSSTSVTGGAGQITIGAAGDSRTIDVGGGTLDEVVNAINSQADFGVTATAVKVADGAYRLQLIGTKPGAGNTISLDPTEVPGLGGGWLTISAATDAQITVGTPPNSYTVTSDSNALTGLLPGLTVTLGREGETVTVTSSRDKGKLADQVSAMVDALNAALGEIAKQTKYDAGTRTASALTGNSTVRQLQQQLAQAITGSSDSTASSAGITLQRDGTVAFDRDKFLDAFAKDPVGTQALFSQGAVPGLGARLTTVIDQAINATDGLLTSAQGATTKVVNDLEKQIEAYQLRLDRRQITLRNQFTAMERALSTLSSQSSWLTSQLDSFG